MTSKTRVLIVNTPHNPSGKVFSRDELSSLLEVCRKHDCFVLTDEIYDQVTYAPYQHTAVASVADEHDSVITTGGISKTFATTGWRLGYVAAPPTVSRTSSQFSSITFGADIGSLKEGTDVSLRFSGGGYSNEIKGQVYGTLAEEGITGVIVDLKHDDALWEALTGKERLSYSRSRI